MTLKRPFQAVNGVLALLFFLFAWVQHNDVDPAIYHNPSPLDAWLWLFFYLLIGVLLVVVIWKKAPAWLLIIAAIACAVEMIRTGPGLYQNLFGDEDFTMTQVSMSASDPRVELSREFFGALISLLAVAWIWIQHRLPFTLKN